MKLALQVILGAGFGRSFSWEQSSDEIAPGHEISFRVAVDNLMRHIAAPLFLSKFWMDHLPLDYVRIGRQAYNEFQTYMMEMLEEERSSSAQGNSDCANLLSALVRNKGAEGKSVLSDEEIRGNLFIFIVAGFETTANTLMFAWALLALHPEEQEMLYNDTIAILGDRDPEYGEFTKLTYALCVMFETLRMFPPVVLIPKTTGESEQTLSGHVLPPHQVLYIDVVAAHRNPKIYPDPHEFRPSRWDGRGKSTTHSEDNQYTCLNMPPRGSFVPFSDGPRACLGRKFSEVEFVTAMTLVSREYTFEFAPGWTRDMVWKALNASETQITLQPPSKIPLALRRRANK